jgi:hypothetical protein
MDTSQLDRTIVEHLSDLDSAAGEIERIERRVWEAMSERMEEFASSAGWAGQYQIDDDLSVHPPEWTADGARLAWFELGFGPDDDESGLNFDLARLCGVNGGQVCLWILHGGRRTPWKAVAKAQAASLAGLGFSINDYANFYMDCTPSQAAMAQALSDDDFELALQPLAQALARLPSSVPALTAMLQQAKVI